MSFEPTEYPKYNGYYISLFKNPFEPRSWITYEILDDKFKVIDSGCSYTLSETEALSNCKHIIRNLDTVIINSSVWFL